ncbi:MAG TPA: hypothetical protein VMZ71_06925, partial [Gemmataceae bacterium]|nr:hypothetical protein [Gemmataceae bacterium]
MSRLLAVRLASAAFAVSAVTFLVPLHAAAQEPVFKLRTELGGGDLSGAQLSAYAPDGKTLFVAAGGMHTGEVYVVDTVKEKKVGVLRTDRGPNSVPRYPPSLAASPDGKWLAVAHQLIESDRAARPKETGWDLQLWDIAEQKLAARKQGDRWELHHLTFSTDGKSLAGGAGGYAKETDGSKAVAFVWEVPGLAQKHAIESKGSGFSALGFTATELRGFRDGEFSRWDLATGKPLKPRRMTNRGMLAYGTSALGPNGKTLAVLVTVSNPNGLDIGAEVSLYDTATGGKPRAVACGHTRHPDRVTFSPDSKLVVTTSPDQTAVVWDADNLAVLTTIPSYGHVAFTPDSKRLALGGTDVWGTDGRHWYTLGRHATQVFSIAFHPKSWGLVRGQNTPLMRFWDVNTRRNDGNLKLDMSQRTIRALAYSPNGFYVAGGEGAKIKIVRSLWVSQTLEDHTTGVNAIAFSADGKFMASASGSVAFRNDEPVAEPGEVIIWRWNGDKATKLHTLKAHPNGTFALAFSP